MVHVVAATNVTCLTLSRESYDEIAKTHPTIHNKMLENIMLMNLHRLRMSGSALAERNG